MIEVRQFSADEFANASRLRAIFFTKPLPVSAASFKWANLQVLYESFFRHARTSSSACRGLGLPWRADRLVRRQQRLIDYTIAIANTGSTAIRPSAVVADLSEHRSGCE